MRRWSGKICQIARKILLLRHPGRIRTAVRPMNTEHLRTCPSCGNEFSGAMEFCPVCMLRKALAAGVQSGESSASEDTVKPTPVSRRLEHYELVTDEDGKPIELGRGAMGVTYSVRRRSAMPRGTESHQRANCAESNNSAIYARGYYNYGIYISVLLSRT